MYNICTTCLAKNLTSQSKPTLFVLAYLQRLWQPIDPLHLWIIGLWLYLLFEGRSKLDNYPLLTGCSFYVAIRDFLLWNQLFLDSKKLHVMACTDTLGLWLES